MKPTATASQFNEHSDASGRNRTVGSAFPKVEYNYQPKGVANFNSSNAGRCTFNSPFRSISDDYFKSEARGEYALELALFGLVSLIATVPVIQSAAAVINLVRTTGVL